MPRRGIKEFGETRGQLGQLQREVGVHWAVNPQVDASRIVRCEGRIAPIEVRRRGLVDGARLNILPVRRRLRGKPETARRQLTVEIASHQVLEVASAHDPCA